MHPQSLQLTIGGTVQKQSDDLDILGVTSDSKKTYEKDLCSISIPASQRILHPEEVLVDFMIDCFLGDAFRF